MPLWLLAGAPASAKVRWENPELSFDQTPAETSVAAGFTCTNVGRAPAVIESIQTCCACLTAQPTRKTCPHGEQGSINVPFNLAQRTGLQMKPISVLQFSGQLKPVSLTMKVHLPEVLKLDSSLVFWDANTEAAAHSFDLELIPGTPARIDKTVSPDPGFTARLETAGPHKRDQLQNFAQDARGRDASAEKLFNLIVPPQDESPSYDGAGRVAPFGSGQNS